MKIKIILLFLSYLTMVISCKTADKTSKINYMQDVEQFATAASEATATSMIQKNDQLIIFVSAKDMEVVKPFNQSYYSSQNSISTTPSNNTSSEKGYLVNSEGLIDFPVLGPVDTTGKTLEELRDNLIQKISVYVKNPNVTVRLANFKVTLLGEINRPGQYTISDINPTLLGAIGLAGDLTIYGKRDNVLIVRNINGQPTKERLNLYDPNFINSPYYQLKQGDVIYISANETKEKLARLDPNTGTYLAIAGTVLGLAGIFITIFKK